ncbi:MAG: methyltransferase domain-containing protein [Candidatus Promineofilum sp.]|nr:methyltransferase domain-containing protein [Promineifilum sp.]
MIQHIHHVQITIAAADEAAARDFYVNVLGLRPTAKPDSLQGRGGFWVEVDDQQLHVGIEEGVERARTKAHVAYQVDDLAAWRERLAAAGVAALESVPIPGFDRFECRDPFGNRLEFIQPLPVDEEPTRRFTSRADNYARFRPTYPAAALDWLWSAAGLSAGRVVADVGAGTGILTALLLERGATVYAVEPNAAMRAAAEAWLGGRPGFVSVDATAEATGLPDAGVELITAGQAFHWFEPAATRAEFRRILRPGGAVGLIWNSRDKQDPFVAGYEALLEEYARHTRRARHSSVRQNIDLLFGRGYEVRIFHHERPLDYEQLYGVMQSESHNPLPGDPRHEPLVAGLQALFAAHQRDGQVVMPYRTQVFFGRLSS